MKRNKRLLLGLTSILALGMFMGGVSAEGAGDVSSDINPVSSGCSGKDSCWLSLGENKPVYGIRVSIVDSNGNLVSGKSMDYLGHDNWTYKINNNTNYYRFKGTKVNRLAYINGQASSTSMSKHDGTTIAKTWKNMPDIFHSDDAAESIEIAILSMTEDKLTDLFFKDLNYTPKNSELKNHYMIIEPLTIVSANGKTIYYGTYYELTKQLINTYNYQNSSNGKSWIASVLDMSLPLSLYIKGNSDIKGSGGYDANSGSYFNGRLLIAKDSYLWYQESKDRWRVKTDNVKNAKLGYGIGIIWMGNLEIINPTCDYNNPNDFASATSGPGGIDCCDYVLDNIDNYDITKSELFSKYPRCGSSPSANACEANISYNGATCNSKNTIEVSDDFDKTCMYESAYSNDKNWQNYFVEYGKINQTCSISCQYKVNFEYPLGQIDVLAGNRFSISSSSSSYSIGINPTTNRPIVNYATLGPIKSIVQKDCEISGEINDCITQVNDLFPTEIAPELYFEYNSSFYTNPKMKLDKETTLTKENNSSGSFTKEWTTYYKLPNDTYKWVSKLHGISYINDSSAGTQPLEYIGPHAPIHFGETGKTDYTITIDKFNINNFDKYIKDGTKIASYYKTSIETYIQRLIELGELNLKNVNGIYYFSDSFTNLLINPQRKTSTLDFEITDFLSMSCANTSTYSCSSDDNGIYCLNKGTNQNNEDTYTNAFRTCIENRVTEISQEYAETDFKQDLNYTCDFNVVEGNGNPNINVIFRQISLNNPFPGKDGSERNVGINWRYAEDSSPTNEVVTEVITKNRGVETDKIYKELDPLYKITLTPALIKRIRKYNNDNPYVISDEDITDQNVFVCTDDKCLSPFIRDEDKFKNEFSGCGITNASVGLTCASGESW